ncbi:MAG: redox-sensing transcriptional repressor Rex [Anaerolineaceae bacterium]|nr:redox-sensing transcriptional repressor Rex [Anaerolineaceae bacterium]
MEKKDIPINVVTRIPLYLQTLNQMARDGVGITSSKILSEMLGITAAQIRKDLSYFGGFGKQGSGYQLFTLIDELQKILNVNRIWQLALVGVGDLGHALIHYHEFARHGFEILMAFDKAPGKIGKKVGTLIIQSYDSLPGELKKGSIRIAILTVPASTAKSVADLLVESGVKAILNYAPVNLQLPDDVYIQNMDPIQSLQRMTFYLEG